jgi:hypothetical protein
VKWPGLAAVVVSVIQIAKKGLFAEQQYLNDRRVENINAYLFHRGGNDDPARLHANTGGSFQGYVVVGMGFTFDDTDNSGVANSIESMHSLIKKDSRNKEVIFPYIGVEEVNSNPSHSYHRYIINFDDREESECRHNWPDLMAVVEAKVRTEREAALAISWSKDKEKRAKKWWQFARTAKDLFSAIENLDRVLVIPQTSNTQALAFLPSKMIYANTLIVFPFSTYSAFATLNSRVHQMWTAFLGPTMKDDYRYTPTDCFETFPFPLNWEANSGFEEIGKEYYEFRAALMVRNNEGLTATYNRFHNPEERDPDILKLREMHSAMDRAVLEAYGWNDIPTACDFFLDYEIDEEEWGDKKKPYRYRWPDEVRDEVLARLLELNAERAKAEALESEAKAVEEAKNKPAKSGKGRKKKPEGMEDMFS